MKKTLIISAIAISGLIYSSAKAQGLHIGLQLQGPARVEYTGEPVQVDQAPVFADDDDDFYYLPDVGAYYDVDSQCYFYFNGYNWISAAYLPGEYRYYDWRNARRFEVRERRPFMRDDFYRERYSGRRIAEWARPNYNNHFDGGYANRGYGDRFENRGHRDYRDADRFENRGERGYGDRDRFENRRQRDSRDGDRFDNRDQYNKKGNDRFDNRGQHFDNRGQRGFQPAQQNKNNGQRFDNRRFEKF